MHCSCLVAFLRRGEIFFHRKPKTFSSIRRYDTPMRFFFVVFISFFLGCAMTQTAAHSPARSEALHTLVEDFYEAWLQLNPIEATYIGDHRFNHLLGQPRQRRVPR